MSRLHNLICAAIAASALFCGSAPVFAADTLQDVLHRMDEAAPSFHAMTATVTMVEYTAVIDDKTTSTGNLQIQKLGPNDLRAIIAFHGGSSARTLALMGKLVEIYYPNVNTYQKYDLGSQGQKADQYLLLGFGTSGTDLAQGYDIQLIDSEKVGSRDTTKLQLTPKDANVRQHLAKVYLWIPLDAGYPIQQQFFDPPPSQNWRKVTYSDVDLHPTIPGPLQLKLPKNAREQK